MKICAWEDLAQGNEIGGFGHIVVPNPQTIEVRDVFLLQQWGESAFHSMDPTSLSTLWATLYKKHGLQPRDLRFHWHTHPWRSKTGPTKSAKDESTVEKLFSNFDFILTAIYDTFGGAEYVFDQFKPFRMRERPEVDVRLPSDEITEDIRREFEENYKQGRQRQPHYPTSFQIDLISFLEKNSVKTVTTWIETIDKQSQEDFYLALVNSTSGHQIIAEDLFDLAGLMKVPVLNAMEKKHGKLIEIINARQPAEVAGFLGG